MIPEGIAKGLYISGVSLAVVFFVLSAIACVVAALGRIVRAGEDLGKRKEKEKNAAAAAAATPPDASAPLNEETVAAIVAAVSIVMQGKRFRIASLSGYDVQTARWAVAGRQKLLRKG